MTIPANGKTLLLAFILAAAAAAGDAASVQVAENKPQSGSFRRIVTAQPAVRIKPQAQSDGCSAESDACVASPHNATLMSPDRANIRAAKGSRTPKPDAGAVPAFKTAAAGIKDWRQGLFSPVLAALSVAAIGMLLTWRFYRLKKRRIN